MNKTLSVSVAAYNVEQFIEQCLDSFMEESVLRRVEVLVTDDGSTDRTAEIVRAYYDRYPDTFILISQKNAGAGSTVNSGLRHATGKYFRMVDGDDWVNTADMKKFLDFLDSADVDMVCANYCRVDNETGETRPEKLRPKAWGEILLFEDACPERELAMHNVTYRTELLKENDIRLDNGFYTDREYLMLPLPYVKTVAFLDLTIYMYRVSLAGQSMNMKSLRRNRQMHRLVLDRLTETYTAFENTAGAPANTLAFFRRCYATMAGMQLSIYLSMEDTSVYKKEASAWLSSLREQSGPLYDEVMKAKTFKLLKLSGFALFPVIAAAHRKKLGLTG